MNVKYVFGPNAGQTCHVPRDQFIDILIKSGVLEVAADEVRQPVTGHSVTRAVVRRLFPSGNPIPGKTCASACCTNTFASFSSPPMSSSGCWKTVRAGAQTTARAHPGRACGNSVLPRRRLVDSPEEIPFPAGMSSMHPRPPRGKSGVPTESPVHPVPDSGLDTVRLWCEAKKNIHLRLRR